MPEYAKKVKRKSPIMGIFLCKQRKNPKKSGFLIIIDVPKPHGITKHTNHVIKAFIPQLKP